MPPTDSPQRKFPANGDREVDRLYRAVFGTAAPDIIASRFHQASQLIERKYSEVDRALYVKALEFDVEAVEVAARYTGRMPLLCEKLRLVVYIAETDPANYARYINTQDSLTSALASIIGGGIRTAFKLAKGLLLIGKVTRA